MQSVRQTPTPTREWKLGSAEQLFLEKASEARRCARCSSAPSRQVGSAASRAADLGREFATIRLSDRQRVVNVTADVDRKVTSDTAVVAALESGPLGAASGVVVNASLMLVHYVNQRREEGIELEQAVRESAVTRR